MNVMNSHVHQSIHNPVEGGYHKVRMGARSSLVHVYGRVFSAHCLEKIPLKADLAIGRENEAKLFFHQQNL